MANKLDQIIAGVALLLPHDVHGALPLADKLLTAELAIQAAKVDEELRDFILDALVPPSVVPLAPAASALSLPSTCDVGCGTDPCAEVRDLMHDAQCGTDTWLTIRDEISEACFKMYVEKYPSSGAGAAACQVPASASRSSSRPSAPATATQRNARLLAPRRSKSRIPMRR